MARLEELTPGALVRGVLGDRLVRVVNVEWHGSTAVTLTFTDEASGRPDQELLHWWSSVPRRHATGRRL